MKCVKNDKEVIRVSNDKAAELVASKGYEYTNKDEWKRFVSRVEEE